MSEKTENQKKEKQGKIRISSENMMPIIKKWLSSDSLSAEEKAELNAISGDDREIRERFSFGLTFGTGGLRGIMKTGMNAMNVHTVAQATQGLANHILKCKKDNGGVVVGRDSRINSELFAKTAARVLAANGIKVYIFRKFINLLDHFAIQKITFFLCCNPMSSQN